MKKLIVGTFIVAAILLGATLNGYLDLSSLSAPANPVSGAIRLYADSSTGRLGCKTSSGAGCLIIRPYGYTFYNSAGLSSGQTGYMRVPAACTITDWSIIADSGTATIKLWKKATGTAIPTVTDSISTSGLSLLSGTAVYSTTLTDFTSTSIAANDWVAVNLAAVAGATFVNFTVGCAQ